MTRPRTSGRRQEKTMGANSRIPIPVYLDGVYYRDIRSASKTAGIGYSKLYYAVTMGQGKTFDGLHTVVKAESFHAVRVAQERKPGSGPLLRFPHLAWGTTPRGFFE
jgi:hypothetical protein